MVVLCKWEKGPMIGLPVNANLGPLIRTSYDQGKCYCIRTKLLKLSRAKHSLQLVNIMENQSVPVML